MQDFKNKVAVVTGGASGIGLGMALNFARAGMAVALCDIQAGQLDKAVAQASELGAKAMGIQTDVSNLQSVQKAAEQVVAEMGRIDIACNNAGVVVQGKTLEEVSAEEWDWMFSVNVHGVINGIKAFVPHIRRHGQGGHVVNTSSIAGFQVNEGWKVGAYAATKFAVVAISEQLSQDLAGTGIGVSVLAPGGVESNLHHSAEHRQARFGGGKVDPDAESRRVRNGFTPDMVGRRVLAAIRDGEFYIFTHLESKALLWPRHEKIIRAFDAAERWAAAEGLPRRG